MADDAEYYSMRMRQEMEAARRATSPKARECHQQLASAYDLRCRLLRRLGRPEQEQRVGQALEYQAF